MRYLVNVIAAGPATADEMAAIDVFNADLQAQGHWVLAGGLAGPDGSTTIDARGSNRLVTDGPFVETTEYVAGFWVIDAADDDEARALAVAGSHACNRKVEVRPFL